jgi:hypothetical protein
MFMQKIHVLKNKFEGQPIAVLGGGPSLPEDLKKLPDGTILMGVNQHASKIVKVDYMVFCDVPHDYEPLFESVNKHISRRITPVPGYSDFDLSGVDILGGEMTGTFATWCALFMGGNPVLLCGMNCFQGEKKYFHNDHARSHPAHFYPVENHLNAWRRVFENFEGKERIKVVSGPLTSVFGKFEQE